MFKELKEPWKDTLVSSRSSNPPERMEEGVLTNITIKSDLSKVPFSEFQKVKSGSFWGEKPTYKAVYDLVISLRNGHLDISLQRNGKSYGQADVWFDTETGEE